MTAEKVLSVIAIYREKFEALNVDQVDHPHDSHCVSIARSLEHCHAMLDKMEVFIVEGRMDKVYRWLGFLQGVLWSQGIYTLTDLTNHNRKDSE
jgi:metal-responsive CopG/Arc/MetJ family transcriptional regulator